MSNYIEDLKELILKIDPLASPASGGRFIVTKCVFCSDGKHNNSRHFYLAVGDDNQVPWCYCHICHTYTRITPDFLSTYYDIYDVDMLTRAYIHNNKVYSNNKHNIQIGRDKDVYLLHNNYVQDNELSRVKLKYVNNRLGTNLMYDDILRYKIVLNLFDLLESNKIEKLTRHENVVRELDKSFLGFISADNAFVNLRNLRKGKIPIKSIDRKYINYSTFDKKDNTQRFYILPTNIDLNNSQRIKICIAEGGFDILSIYHNVRNKEPHTIYSAVLGSGYINIIKHFINRLKLLNIEIHLYKDNDMKEYLIKNLYDTLMPLQIPFYLHYNTYEGEKDFGVPKEKIIEKIERLI